MQNTANAQTTGITVLTAINIAKITTIGLLVAFAVIFGIQDLRQVIYLCLHIGYCLWWLLEQWIYPQRRQIFNQPIGVRMLVFVLLFVGFLYALPGYLAFTNPAPLSMIEAAIALPLYTFGTLINAIADVQKLAAKQHGAGLVSDGIWRFSRNINYFGDLLRYLSFSVVAGSPWAYLVPVAVLFASLQRMSEKDQSMSAKYPDYPDYQKSTARLIPFIRIQAENP
jgi:protein-S-isoprenylcysteine O-methyltransferase Ste14